MSQGQDKATSLSTDSPSVLQSVKHFEATGLKLEAPLRETVAQAPWSKVVHYIGNRVLFGTQKVSESGWVPTGGLRWEIELTSGTEETPVHIDG
jgi:hypothetical protein